MRLVAFQPDIAANLGAVLRLAACFGAAVDVVEPCGFPFSIKAVRRVGLDYVEQVEIVRHDSWAAYLATRPAGRLLLLSTTGEKSLWDFTFRPDDRLLLGRESAGAPEEVRRAADAALRIPMRPETRSLNVAMAAAIALAEATRQTGAAANGLV